MKPFVIAIDGPSASGKGTLARNIASSFGYAYLDTGALYRCVGRLVLDAGQDPSDEDVAVKAAQTLAERLNPEDLQHPGLRLDQVSQAASKVAKFPAVRQALFDFQRQFSTDERYKGVILDGRDIGTVICPDADVKLFVTASVETRAERRLKELQSKGFGVTYEAVLADMRERDARDMGRDFRPLKPAPDAVLLDTSDMDAQTVLEKAIGLIRAALAK